MCKRWRYGSVKNLISLVITKEQKLFIDNGL